MQRKPCAEFDPRRAQAKSTYKHDWKNVIRCIVCARVHACPKSLPQLKNEDPDFHAASVIQHAVYNARPEVRARAHEYRRGPVGYPLKVINDAIR